MHATEEALNLAAKIRQIHVPALDRAKILSAEDPLTVYEGLTKLADVTSLPPKARDKVLSVLGSDTPSAIYDAWNLLEFYAKRRHLA